MRWEPSGSGKKPIKREKLTSRPRGFPPHARPSRYPMGWATRQTGTRLAANRIVFTECDKFRRPPHAPTTIVESSYLVTFHLIIAYLVTPDLITVDGFVTQNDIALFDMKMQVYFGWMD